MPTTVASIDDILDLKKLIDSNYEQLFGNDAALNRADNKLSNSIEGLAKAFADLKKEMAQNDLLNRVLKLEAALNGDKR
jgi:hypothetical protein